MATELQSPPLAPIDTLPYCQLPDNLDADAAVQSCIEKLNSLSEQDVYAHAAWRDLLAFTNCFRTFHQPQHIVLAWKELSSLRQPTNFRLQKGSTKAMQLGPIGFIRARFTFETRGSLPAECSGVIFVIPDGKVGWKIWIMATFLKKADTLGDPDVLEKVQAPLPNGEASNSTQGSNGTEVELVDCVIVGAGQNGLSTLGRLKALGVKAIALEKHAQIGGNWLNRYDSAKLHTGKWYATMPFEQTFRSDEYPYFLTRTDLARGFTEYVNEYGLDVRLSTAVESASWDEHAKIWTVKANQNGTNFTLKGRHIIFAIGSDQKPYMPNYPNRETFKGTVIHSVDYKSPREWKSLRAVVVGTANTAHDVAEDMVEEELPSVTMVQRSPTIVVPFDFFKVAHNQNYNSESNYHESDQTEWGLPSTFYEALPRFAFRSFSTRNPEQFDALERVGFKTKRAPNLMKEIRERGGGHYLDVGCSKMIVEGLIKIKGGEIESYTSTGLMFTDGSALDADVIVFCTGFKNNVRLGVEEIVGPKIGALLEDLPGRDEEGETPGFFAPQRHPAIWYATGELAMARLYGRYLALQIKAAIAGVPFEPYLKTP
ncbi:flavin-containing monooxygenase [Cadophora sp. MPI-SDFR-AT-0126]|nr:flavin-containing monooxygenase [Leotiomycetes sp. MPI-SDFR-AT-0126]